MRYSCVDIYRIRSFVREQRKYLIYVCYHEHMKKLSADLSQALIILNPTSGQGNPTERRRQIPRLAKQFGWDGKLTQTTVKRTAFAIASESIARGVKHIVVCGGDGTIREVLSAAVKKPVSIGIVPLGTGNLFARNIGISLKLDEAMETALTGVTKKIDVGKANETYFSILAGIGMDAEVMKKASRELKDKLGIGAYVISTIKSLRTRRGKYLITIDKQNPKVYRAKSIMVANMGRIQGGIQAVPKAHPQSGDLKIGILKARGISAWVSIVTNAIRGNINKSPHYTLLSGQEIKIVSLSGPKPYECDGEHFPPTNTLSISIYPKSISLFLPSSQIPA